MIPPSVLQTRQKKLIETLQQNGPRAIAINPSPSLHYLTGLHFHFSERPVVVFFSAQNDPVIVLPELEAAKLQEVQYPLHSFTYGEDPTQWSQVFAQALQAAGLEKAQIGAESRALRLLELRLLQEAAPEATVLPADEVIATLRMYKDESEIAAMQQAAQIAQEALQATLPAVKIGVTEKEIAAELSMQLLRHGSNPQLPFFPIVSGGPNSANPHAAPSERKLQAGDLLVIDWGANVDGYFSDITRTFAIGEVDTEFRRIAEIVLAANQAAHATARPSVPAAAVDRAAREVIASAGYGKYFTHRTGHGLGLEGHEEPYIRGDNQMPLEPGMSFTIEPGIYLTNRNGVRIEDDVVITTDGCQSLTDLPRALITLA